jgi:succinate-acetate transporter protein
MSQTTLDVAFGIVLANLIPLGLAGLAIGIYVLSILGLDLFDNVKRKFLRKDK